MSQLRLLFIILLFISLYRTTNCFIEPELESGWDADAEAIYDNQMNYIVEQSRTNENSIHSIATFPLENVTYFIGTGSLGVDSNNTLMLDFVKNLDGINNQWEPSTFKIFLKYLPTVKHYIDIGTWIGPTLFFSTQLVPFALGKSII